MSIDPSLLEPFQGLLTRLLPDQGKMALSSDPNPQPNPIEAGVQAFQQGMQEQGGNVFAAAPGALGAAAQTALSQAANALVPPSPDQQKLAQQQSLEHALSDQRQVDAVRVGSLLDERGQERANFRPESSGFSGVAQGVGQAFSDLGTNLQRPDLNPLQKAASVGGAAMQLGQEAVINPVTQGMQTALGTGVNTPLESDLNEQQRSFISDVYQRQGPSAAWNAYWKIQELANPDSLYNKPIIKGAFEGAPLGVVGETGAVLRGVEGTGAAATAARAAGTALGAADILAQGPLAATHIPHALDVLKENAAAAELPEVVSREGPPSGWETTGPPPPDAEVIRRASEVAAVEQGKNLNTLPQFSLPGGYRLGNGAALDSQGMRELMSRPYVAPLAEAAGSIFKGVDLLVGWGMDNPSRFMGFEAGTEAMGRNVTWRSRSSNEVWISPWALVRQVRDQGWQDMHAGLAREMVDTFIHEIAHNSERGHGSAFEDILNRLYDQIGVQRLEELQNMLAERLRVVTPNIQDIEGDLERLMDAPSGYRSVLDTISRTPGDQLTEDSLARAGPEGGAGVLESARQARNQPGDGLPNGAQGPGQTPSGPPPGVTAEGRLDPGALYEGQQVRIAGRDLVAATPAEGQPIVEQDAQGKYWINAKDAEGNVQQFPLENARPSNADLAKLPPPAAQPTTSPQTTRLSPQATQPSTAALPRTPSPVRPQTGADGVPVPPVQALQKALHDALYPSGSDQGKITGLGTFVADADIMRDLNQMYEEQVVPNLWSMSWDQIAERAATKLGYEDGEALAAEWRDTPRGQLAATIVAGQSLLARYAERAQALRYALQNGAGDEAAARRELEMTNAKMLQVMAGLRKQSGELGRGLGIMRRAVEMAQARDLARQWENRNSSVADWLKTVRQVRQIGKLNDNVRGQLLQARDQINQWLKSYGQASDTPLMDQNIELQVLGRNKKGQFTKIQGQPESAERGRMADETRAYLANKLDATRYKQIRELNSNARHEAGLGLQANVDKLLQEREKVIDEMHQAALKQKMAGSTWKAIEKALREPVEVVAPKTEFQKAVDAVDEALGKLMKAGKDEKEIILTSQGVLDTLGMLNKVTEAEARKYREKIGRAYIEGRIKTLPYREEVVGGVKKSVPNIPDEFRNFLNSTNFDYADPRKVQIALRMLGDQNWWDQYKLIRVASLLSDTATIFLHPVARAVWTATAPAIDVARAAVEKPLAAAQHRPPEATFGMAAEEFKTMWGMHPASPEEQASGYTVLGLAGAIPHALVTAWDSARTNTSSFNVLDQYAARGGTITWLPFRPLNTIFRAMNAMNDFFEDLNTSMLTRSELEREVVHLQNATKADRVALRDSIYAQADANHIDRSVAIRQHIFNNILDFPEVLERAKVRAQERNFNEPMTGFWKTLSSTRANSTVGFLIPFFKISANVVRSGFRFTPYGFKEGIDSARAGDLATAADRYGQAVFGSMLMIAAGVAASQGILTGYGPSDPHKREELLNQGWQPFAFFDGHGYTPYEKILGMYAMPLIFATSLVDAMKEGMGKDDAQAALTRFIYDAGAALTSGSALFSFKQIFDFLSDPKRYGGRAAEGFMAGTLPYVGFGHTIQRIIDPEDRSPRGVVEYMLSQIPGYGALYETGMAPGPHGEDASLAMAQQPLDPRTGPTGLPTMRPGYGLRNLTPAAPAKWSEWRPDEVIAEAEAQGNTLSLPGKVLGRGPLKEQLTPSLLNAYDALAGQYTSTALKHLYQTDIYTEATPTAKSQLVTDWTSIAHRTAREQLGIVLPSDQDPSIPLKYRGVTDRAKQAQIDAAVASFDAAKRGGPAPTEEQLRLVTQYADPTMRTPEYTAYSEAKAGLRAKAEGETAAILGNQASAPTGPERQSLINALQIQDQIKNTPRYINLNGQPVGTREDWDRWDKTVKAWDALTPRERTANRTLGQQVNAIKAAQNPELIRLADSSLDYQRWLGVGAKLDVQKWQQLQSTPKFVQPGSQRPAAIGGRASGPQDWANWTAYMAAYKKLPPGQVKNQATPTYRLLRRMLNPAWVNAIPIDKLYELYGTDILNETAA